MTVAEVLQQFSRVKVLVVGDVCLDRWCRYDPRLAEPSAETSLPRVAVVRTEVTPGAAGTVANNLIALGVDTVAVLGAIGDDGNGLELQRALTRNGISPELLVQSGQIATFTYTKLINEQTNVEDIPRVDVVNRENLPEEVAAQVHRQLVDVVHLFDVIIVSDQAETDRGGVVGPLLRTELAHLAADNPQKVFWVDSRRRAAQFRHAILKINQQEASQACRQIGVDNDYAALCAHTASPLLLVTQGPKGVMMVDPEGRQTHIPTRATERPVDICGAGDSFSAGAALSYAIAREPALAARLGNLVASITIMKPGTGTASPDEVLRAAAEQEVGA